MHIHIYVYTYICIYIYVYIYVYVFVYRLDPHPCRQSSGRTSPQRSAVPMRRLQGVGMHRLKRSICDQQHRGSTAAARKLEHARPPIPNQRRTDHQQNHPRSMFQFLAPSVSHYPPIFQVQTYRTRYMYHPGAPGPTRPPPRPFNSPPDPRSKKW